MILKFNERYKMIYTNIPFAPESSGTNLGVAYNKFMEMLPNDDDWGCFLDHDAMFTTKDWYNQLENIIKKYPDIGAFGARTNRLNCTYQVVGNIDVYKHDISYHRKIGKYIQTKYYDDLLKVDKNTLQIGFSGVVILIKKSTWKQIDGFKTEGFNHVDNDLRYRIEAINQNLHIMNGIYVYHWYSADKPYDRCVEKFKVIDDHYKKNNKPFDINKVFLYNGRENELPA